MKLKKLLKIASEIRISLRNYNILGWLVYETIAVLVDYSVLTRLNTGNRWNDPLCRVPSGNFNTELHHFILYFMADCNGLLNFATTT